MARPDEDGLITCRKCNRNLPGDEVHFHGRGDEFGFDRRCKECQGGDFEVHQPNRVYDIPKGSKVCTKCLRQLPKDAEHFHRRGDGFRSKCKECRGTAFGVHDLNRKDTKDGFKICTNCRRELPADVEHFHTSNQDPTGYVCQCKECMEVGFGMHRINASNEIPEGKRYCKGCEKIYPATTDFFGPHGDILSSRCRECDSQRKNSMRRSFREKVEINLTGKDWNQIKEKWSENGTVYCCYCSSPTPKPERDHILAISKGGDTVFENIAPACTRCNRSKSNSNAMEWYYSQDFYEPERWEKIKRHSSEEFVNSEVTTTNSTVERSG